MTRSQQRAIDEAHDRRNNFFSREVRCGQGLSYCVAQTGKRRTETQQSVQLGFCAGLLPIVVVAILQPAFAIAAHGLNVSPLSLGDTHLGPSGRDGEPADARLRGFVANYVPLAVAVAEALAAAPSDQAKICSLDVSHAAPAAKTFDVSQHFVVANRLMQRLPSGAKARQRGVPVLPQCRPPAEDFGESHPLPEPRSPKSCLARVSFAPWQVYRRCSSDFATLRG